jgi:hypothetical protein
MVAGPAGSVIGGPSALGADRMRARASGARYVWADGARRLLRCAPPSGSRSRRASTVTAAGRRRYGGRRVTGAASRMNPRAHSIVSGRQVATRGRMRGRRATHRGVARPSRDAAAVMSPSLTIMTVGVACGDRATVSLCGAKCACSQEGAFEAARGETRWTERRWQDQHDARFGVAGEVAVAGPLRPRGVGVAGEKPGAATRGVLKRRTIGRTAGPRTTAVSLPRADSPHQSPEAQRI